MRHRQTISKHPRLSTNRIRANSNHAVRSLTSLIPTRKDRVSQRELEEFRARLACPALGNRIERVYNTLIAGDSCITTVLLRVGSVTRSRCKKTLPRQSVCLWPEGAREDGAIWIGCLEGVTHVCWLLEDSRSSQAHRRRLERTEEAKRAGHRWLSRSSVLSLCNT